jgi:hydroxymethylglutaryl-CoA reductase
MDTHKTSRIAEFYKRSLEERLSIILNWSQLKETDRDTLLGVTGLTAEQADLMVENAIGIYGLPLGIATNFLINGRDYLVPLVIEEPSVLAAVSYAAKLFRSGGGFVTSSDEPIMIGQIQVLELDDLEAAANAVIAHKEMLLEEANKTGGSIVKRGGGAKDIEVRLFADTSIGNMLVVHLLFDTQDAMGANAVNTAAEHLAPFIETLTGGKVRLRILSNLSDQRKARAEGMIPANELARGTLSGEEAVKAIVEAGVFAEVDPYRAATHNKGIMNGIDAVVIATGNDWRAVEAGSHAFAARSGSYSSLTKWWQDADGNLRGAIELPLAVGIVGGATRVHPTAQLALKILGVQTARELAEVIVAVGLAQNLAAIRALATEGIQQGHMRMHAKQLAVAAGAKEQEVSMIVKKMVDEGNIRLERAKTLIAELRMQTSS